MNLSTTIDRITFYVTAAAIAIAVTWAAAYSFIVSERDAELQQRTSQAGNVSLLFEQHTLRILHHADTYVRAARRSYDAGGYAAVGDFISHVPLDTGIISHLMLMDRDGFVRYISSDPGAQSEKSSSDREYFQIQERAKADEPYISFPHRGRVSGLQTVRYVMRLTKPDGSFDGIIFAAISVPKLVQFFDSLNLAEDSVFLVVGTDKIVRSHTYAEKHKSTKTTFAASVLWDRLAESPSGIFEENSVLDGIARIYAYRKIAEYPLVAVAGISKTGIHHVGSNAIAVALLITLCILILTALVRDKIMSHERVLGAVFDTAADAILLTDERGVITSANPACERIFGYLREEIIGARLSQIVPMLGAPPTGSEPATLVDRMRQLLGGTQELVGKRRDGSELPLLFSLIETTFGRVSFFTCFLHDYSAQKLMQNLLRQSEGRFKDFAETASDFYWETDELHRFTYLSERFAHASGVSGIGLIGKTREESGISAVDPHALRSHLDDIDSHRAFRDFVYARERGDGTRMWLSISGKPIHDDAGNFLGYRGVGTDITASIEARRELMKAKEEAEHANRAKTIFLSSMSHELRTPLNAIIGFAEALDMGVGLDDPKRRSESLRLIVSAGKQLNELIGDVLDFAKIEEGRIDFDPEPVSPEAIYLECLPVA